VIGTNNETPKHAIFCNLLVVPPSQAQKIPQRRIPEHTQRSFFL